MIDRKIRRPLYRQIYETLRNRVISGALTPGEALPSERELGHELGVNRLTLRQALKLLDGDGLVRRQQGVGTFVEEPSKWNLARSVKRLCLVHWGHEFSDYARGILSALCTEAAAEGMELTTLDGEEAGSSLAGLLDEHRCDAVLAMGTVSRAHIESLAAVSVPKLILEIRDAGPGLDRVVIDSLPGVHEGVSRLIELGHRRIAYVGGLVFDRSDRILKMAPDSPERLKAYRKALEDAGIEYRPELSFEMPYGDKAAPEVVEAMMSLDDPATAVVAFDDFIAMDICREARGRGIDVPDRLSILGFGDFIDESRQGQLATVSVDWKGMARAAVRRMKERLTLGGISGVMIPVGCRFKSGASMGPPRH